MKEQRKEDGGRKEGRKGRKTGSGGEREGGRKSINILLDYAKSL
jgi:hypothetical protein